MQSLHQVLRREQVGKRQSASYQIEDEGRESSLWRCQSGFREVSIHQEMFKKL
jgi:hypothetical protein